MSVASNSILVAATNVPVTPRVVLFADLVVAVVAVPLTTVPVQSHYGHPCRGCGHYSRGRPPCGCASAIQFVVVLVTSMVIVVVVTPPPLQWCQCSPSCDRPCHGRGRRSCGHLLQGLAGALLVAAAVILVAAVAVAVIVSSLTTVLMLS